MKILNEDFVNKTLHKIETVINCALQFYGVEMTYDLNKRNELFCEVVKKTTTDLTTTEMYKDIQNVLHTQSNLSDKQSEWLSQQIFQFNKDIFLLHYFYAIIYTYNYDEKIQQRVTKKHIQGFFEKSNIIHHRYKNLTLS
jgi:hypothetical protein